MNNNTAHEIVFHAWYIFSTLAAGLEIGVDMRRHHIYFQNDQFKEIHYLIKAS
jgi:hypothetical protein